MLRRAVGRRLLRAAAGRSGRSRGLSLQPLAHLGSPGVHTLHDSLGLDSSAAALAGLLATGLPPPAPPPVAPAAASLAELTPAAATAGDVSLLQPHSLEPGAKLPDPPEPPEPPPEPLAQLRDTSDPAAAASAADLASPIGETPAPPALQPVFTPQPVGPPPEGPQAAVFGPSLPVGEEVSPLHIVPLPVLTPGLDAAGKEAAAAAALLTSRDGGFFFHYPMMGIEYLILGVHDVTGLPWWGSIVAATVAGRLILFPLQVYQSRGTANMTSIKPQMDVLTQKMKAGYAKKNAKGMEEAEGHRLALQTLMAKHGVSPFTTMATALISLPVWISFFFTLRRMVLVDGAGLSEGGMLWFSDLTAPDPYLILPMLSGASLFGMASLGDAGQQGASMDQTQQMMRFAMRCVAVLVIPLTAKFEAGVHVYWLTSNGLAVLQTLALRQPAIRNAVGMPPAPSRSAADTPADSVMKSLFSGLPASLTGGAATAPATEAARPILIPKVLLDAPPDHAAGSGKHGGGKGGGRQTGKNKKGGR